ncbi:hypothetical protein QMM92_19985, partial [Leptospira santarosai]|nr:hypothetical protein [Leptospira santarosai]
PRKKSPVPVKKLKKIRSFPFFSNIPQVFFHAQMAACHSLKVWKGPGLRSIPPCPIGVFYF